MLIKLSDVPFVYLTELINLSFLPYISWMLKSYDLTGESICTSASRESVATVTQQFSLILTKWSAILFVYNLTEFVNLSFLPHIRPPKTHALAILLHFVTVHPLLKHYTYTLYYGCGVTASWRATANHSPPLEACSWRHRRHTSVS